MPCSHTPQTRRNTRAHRAQHRPPRCAHTQRTTRTPPATHGPRGTCNARPESHGAVLRGHVLCFAQVWPELTGREHLEIFAAIKGVPAGRVDEMVSKALESMTLKPCADPPVPYTARVRGRRGPHGPKRDEPVLPSRSLRRYADKRTKSYSGGNRRKLSVALALLVRAHRPAGSRCVIAALLAPTAPVGALACGSTARRLARPMAYVGQPQSDVPRRAVDGDGPGLAPLHVGPDLRYDGRPRR
jgi:hypothetical protein